MTSCSNAQTSARTAQPAAPISRAARLGRAFTAGIALLTLSPLACGGGPEPQVPSDKFGSPDIRAEGYDQSCKRDPDCAAIRIGNMCECGCDFGAINSEQVGQYEKDRGFVHCTSEPPSCAECPSLDEAVCENGVCKLVPKSQIGG